ncbi:hypothetical protein HYY69_03910 [Candidatus Woesearchaeota archaeon]|nr:hypothetical protein [Candidatus Woesearchaeota archaeon]
MVDNRIVRALAAGAAACVLYASGSKLVEYVQGFFSSRDDHTESTKADQNPFELPHYTALGKVLDISEVGGVYHLEVEIQAEGSDQDALSTLDCASSCKRTLVVNSNGINAPYRGDLERLVHGELPKGEGVVSTYGTFYVTTVKQGETYMAGVQALSVVTSEKRLLFNGSIYVKNEAPTTQAPVTSEETIIDKIKPYFPIIMKYVDVDDVVKVHEIIENFKDGALDGVLELSRYVNWKKYRQEKQPAELERLLQEIKNIVDAHTPKETDYQGEKTLKTEEVMGTLIGGKRFGRRVKLRVNLEDNLDVPVDAQGYAVLEVNEITTMTPGNRYLLEGFLGKHNWSGCRKNPCGEYGFSGEILPAKVAATNGTKYTVYTLDLNNGHVKGDDDMQPKQAPQQKHSEEEPVASKTNDQRKEEHEPPMPGLLTVLGRGINSVLR